MGDERFVDRDVSGSGTKLVVEAGSGFLNMLLRLANGSVRVNRVGKVGADVGISHGFGSLSEDSGFGKRLQPQFPVFPAHHLDGVGNVFVRCRFDCDLFDLALVGVERFLGVGLANWLEARLVDLAVIRIDPSRGS